MIGSRVYNTNVNHMRLLCVINIIRKEFKEGVLLEILTSLFNFQSKQRKSYRSHAYECLYEAFFSSRICRFRYLMEISDRR